MFVGCLIIGVMVFSKKNDFVNHLKALKTKSKSIGFVPTMGALHDGHISLMKKALIENDHLIVSIFVNPTQFNNPEDLAKYPRTAQKDIDFINSNLNSDQVTVYLPDVDDVYGEHVVSQDYNFDGLEHEMEGANRPGHFDGVGTVLEFFFKLIEPHRAYFGEKDFQQLKIVEKLVEILNLDIQIIGCPIERENTGLARSSRNQRLSEKSRIIASKIYQSLLLAKEIYSSSHPEKVTETIEEVYKRELEMSLEYFVIAHEHSLKPIKILDNSTTGLRAFIVVHIDGVRLIDNLKLS